MSKEQRQAFVYTWAFRFAQSGLFIVIVYFAIGLHLSINSANVLGIAATLSGFLMHLLAAISLIDVPKYAPTNAPIANTVPSQHEHKHLHFHVTARNYPRGHYIYVIRDMDVTGYYKIGRTNTPEIRLSTFEVKLPFRIEIISLFACKNAAIKESELHTQYANKRIRGEWFALESEDVMYLKSLGEKSHGA